MSVENHSLQFEIPKDQKFLRLLTWKTIKGLADYGKRQLGKNYGEALAISTLAFMVNVSNYMARHRCDRETAIRNVPFEFPENIKPYKKPRHQLPTTTTLWNEHKRYRRKVKSFKEAHNVDAVVFKNQMKQAFPFCESGRITEYHKKKLEPYDIAWDLVAQKHCLPFRGDKLRKYLTQVDKAAKVLRMAVAQISQALD